METLLCPGIRVNVEDFHSVVGLNLHVRGLQVAMNVDPITLHFGRV
jgi:hypothetical protein